MINNDKPYRDDSVEDIVRYSNNLIGKKFVDVLASVFNDEELNQMIKYYNNPRAKGGLGNLLEKFYYFYDINNESEPDFKKVGLELKVTPYEKNKKGLRAGERLVISMIPNDRPLESEFNGSKLERKMKLMLIIWYHRIKNQARTLHDIDFINLFDLYSKSLEKDLEIIIDDYKIIAEKVISGKAHELSESDTKYLGACTKGENAEKSLKPQYYNNFIPAKRRAFSLKQSYMTYVLNEYVCDGFMNYDSIFKNNENIQGKFENKIYSMINKYVGLSEDDLYSKFSIDKTTNSKQINRTLVLKILGVNTTNAEEFEKSKIIIKTVRANKNGIPHESMSFPKIVISDFINQEYEESSEYNFFETTRFLFVVFRENNEGEYILAGAKFWNMPSSDLEKNGKIEWESYKKKFIEGVNFTVKKHGDKIVVYNDLPKKSNHKIFHLRPHASKSAYIINGIKYGNGSQSDMDYLPNGDMMTHQCFWLNNEYIAKIIKNIK